MAVVLKHATQWMHSTALWDIDKFTHGAFEAPRRLINPIRVWNQQWQLWFFFLCCRSWISTDHVIHHLKAIPKHYSLVCEQTAENYIPIYHSGLTVNALSSTKKVVLETEKNIVHSGHGAHGALGAAGVTGAVTGLHGGVSAIRLRRVQLQVGVLQAVLQSILVVGLWREQLVLSHQSQSSKCNIMSRI